MPVGLARLSTSREYLFFDLQAGIDFFRSRGGANGTCGKGKEGIAGARQWYVMPRYDREVSWYVDTFYIDGLYEPLFDFVNDVDMR